MNMWKKNSRQRKFVPLLTLLIILGCQEAPQNNAPEISDLIIYPSQPKAGQLVLLTGIADDEDGDRLTYRWVASGGFFLDSLGTNPIRWQAPSQSDTINIFLHVSDQDATTTETQSFYLEPGLGTVAGHVVDETSNNVLADVIVNLNGLDVTTGADGYFEFTEVPTSANVPISASLMNYVTFAELIDVTIDENIVDISMTILTEVGRVAGYVSDQRTGVKLEGVIVQTGEIFYTTGVDGYYELYNVPISENVPIRASLDGYSINAQLINVLAGYNTKNIELEPNIASVSGRVSAEDGGELLAGVIVTINQYQDTTNAAGYYEIANIPALSNASVSAVLDGYVTAFAAVDIIGGNNNLNLELGDNPGSLSGYIISSLNNYGLLNVAVQIGATTVITNHNGLYSATGLPTGFANVRCIIEGYADIDSLIEITPGSNPSLVIYMEPTLGDVEGILSDSLTGLPIEGTLRLGNISTFSNAIGEFLFEDVLIGQYQLLVEIEDYQSVYYPVVITAGLNTHNIELVPSTGTVLGVVYKVSSTAVLPGATVRIGQDSVVTDADGAFELSSVELGINLLYCRMNNHDLSRTMVTIEPGEQIINIELATSIRVVQGTVTDALTLFPIEGVLVTIDGRSDETDALGLYEIDSLVSGTFPITASGEGLGTYTDFVDILPGENIRSIEMSDNHGTVKGNIFDLFSGAYLEDATITLNTTLPIIDTTEIEGYFEFVFVPLGAVMLRVEHENFEAGEIWVTVVPGDNPVNFELSRNYGRVMGDITDFILGSPVDTAIITINADPQLVEICNSQGHYEFGYVPAGTHNITISGVGYTLFEGAITVAAGDNHLDVELSPNHGMVRGYITDLISGAAIDTAVVTINSDTIVTGRTNSGGYFEFENVQLGAFELSVDGVDYVHYQGWVTVYPGDNQIDVDLSPDHGSLVGYISDFSSGLMLDSVLVIINNTDSTYTDVLGYYSIDTPVGSQNSLHTEKTGFNDFDQWVEMSATGSTLDVEMVPSN